jgi:hypothetical protein
VKTIEALARKLQGRLKFLNVGDTILSGPVRYGMLDGKTAVHLARNCHYDGTRWNRYDTAAPAGIFYFTGAVVGWNTVAAGANPIAAWDTEGTMPQDDFLSLPSRASVVGTYAAVYAPDTAVADDLTIRMTLTGNITFGTPASLVVGKRLTLILTQDGTGGRTIAFGGAYRVSLTATTTANTSTTLVFECVQATPATDSWVQVGAAATGMA